VVLSNDLYVGGRIALWRGRHCFVYGILICTCQFSIGSNKLLNKLKNNTLKSITKGTTQDAGSPMRLLVITVAVVSSNWKT
jgi:hypothetical protein